MLTVRMRNNVSRRDQVFPSDHKIAELVGTPFAMYHAKDQFTYVRLFSYLLGYMNRSDVAHHEALRVEELFRVIDSTVKDVVVIQATPAGLRDKLTSTTKWTLKSVGGTTLVIKNGRFKLLTTQKTGDHWILWTLTEIPGSETSSGTDSEIESDGSTQTETQCTFCLLSVDIYDNDAWFGGFEHNMPEKFEAIKRTIVASGQESVYVLGNFNMFKSCALRHFEQQDMSVEDLCDHGDGAMFTDHGFKVSVVTDALEDLCERISRVTLTDVGDEENGMVADTFTVYSVFQKLEKQWGDLVIKRQYEISDHPMVYHPDLQVISWNLMNDRDCRDRIIACERARREEHSFDEVRKRYEDRMQKRYNQIIANITHSRVPVFLLQEATLHVAKRLVDEHNYAARMVLKDESENGSNVGGICVLVNTDKYRIGYCNGICQDPYVWKVKEKSVQTPKWTKKCKPFGLVCELINGVDTLPIVVVHLPFSPTFGDFTGSFQILQLNAWWDSIICPIRRTLKALQDKTCSGSELQVCVCGDFNQRVGIVKSAFKARGFNILSSVSASPQGSRPPIDHIFLMSVKVTEADNEIKIHGYRKAISEREQQYLPSHWERYRVFGPVDMEGRGDPTYRAVYCS